MADEHPLTWRREGAFDPAEAGKLLGRMGHGGFLGMRYGNHGPDWFEAELPWREDLVGAGNSGVLASGPIISLFDNCTRWRSGPGAASCRMSRWTCASTMSARPCRAQRDRAGRMLSATRRSGVRARAGPRWRRADPLAHAAAIFGAGRQRMSVLPPFVLPPFALAMGMALSDSDGEAPVVTMQFGPHSEGRPGFLHGGAIGGLLEMAGFAALATHLGQRGIEQRMKPINISIEYLRAGCPIRCMRWARCCAPGAAWPTCGWKPGRPTGPRPSPVAG
jgi:acyl-coenzyme A thioesterase PaaI-like protein